MKPLTRRFFIGGSFALSAVAARPNEVSAKFPPKEEPFLCISSMPEAVGQAASQGTSGQKAVLQESQTPPEIGSLSEQGVAFANYRWLSSQGLQASAGHIRLGVAFVGNPSQSWRDEVQRRANLWVPPGSKLSKRLSFDFDVALQSAHIRIGQGGVDNRPRANVSLIGNLARKHRLDKLDPQCTMIITQLSSVEHEFGHALCLGHEHQHENLPVKIDRDAAIKYYFENHGWTRKQTLQNVIARKPSCLGDQEYNPASAMGYPVPAEITVEKVALHKFHRIHDRDRACLDAIYSA